MLIDQILNKGATNIPITTMKIPLHSNSLLNDRNIMVGNPKSDRDTYKPK